MLIEYSTTQISCKHRFDSVILWYVAKNEIFSEGHRAFKNVLFCFDRHLLYLGIRAFEKWEMEKLKLFFVTKQSSKMKK